MGVRAGATEFRGNARLVVNFDEESAPPLLHQDWFGRSGGNFDAGFRIDLDADEAIGIKNLLGLLRSIFPAFREKGFQRLLILRRKGRALVVHRFGDTLNLRGERLPFCFDILGKTLGEVQRGEEPEPEHGHNGFHRETGKYSEFPGARKQKGDRIFVCGPVKPPAPFRTW